MANQKKDGFWKRVGNALGTMLGYVVGGAAVRDE